MAMNFILGISVIKVGAAQHLFSKNEVVSLISSIEKKVVAVIK